jgi:3-methyladenine DNA glycosylase AlkD
MVIGMSLTAKRFIQELESIRKTLGMDVPKIQIFNLAKDYDQMVLSEVVKLLTTDDHDFRVGAVAILDWKARSKKTSDSEKREVYEAYIQHHQWIDDWGLVDRAAPYVVGGYLYDKDRSPLYKLAKSDAPMERRTAIVSTYFFIRKGQTEDTFSIAEILINDTNIYVQKAVGSWIREAGKQDSKRLMAFLDQYASTMPRITLQYAIEKFDRKTKEHYLGQKRST